jgi:hypothetical protein
MDRDGDGDWCERSGDRGVANRYDSKRKQGNEHGKRGDGGRLCPRWQPGMSGATSGTTGSSTPGATASARSKYILTNAMIGPSETAATASPSGSGSTTPGGSTTGATGTGTAGTTATGSPSARADKTMMGTSYMLDGNDSELKNHVGHRVEVKGTVAGGSASGMSSSGSPTGGSATGSSTTSGGGATGSSSTSTGTAGAGGHGAMAANHLRVSSIRMLSANCSDSPR